ncbi:hypothetical protein E5S70_30240 [Ensifer adhaerens]|uniref:hypothetical protein n=1 Tax=Ensifer canadensis TaxID=555315 RepID=UPI00148FE7FF|nr:hypothetical protein [Ensifer canadensis]NOV20287.1 hypothetical protein [Ensifer canadensis]
MAAGFFSTLGMVMLIGGPATALYFSSSTGMPVAAILAGSSIGSAVTLFAVAVIVDRLDKLVAASKAA